MSDAQRTLEQRFANPFLRRLLKSPLHRLASRWFVLVSYVGRQSGRRYTFPVVYATAQNDLVVVTPKADSNWWKKFRDPTACHVWYRGGRYTAMSEVTTGETAVRLLDIYTSSHPFMARGLGLSNDSPEPTVQLSEATEELAVVRFSPDR
ncbi:hypothetical protein GJR96_14875 [Haloferax sp. MBLA0076]|uniref:DUF385 domain-containing protein n=1 Tax=Haloferax litoreum TaxID=2666140 RepID=A0A6A8GIN5_9EURY|nr:hypothetical protein Hfx1148_14805 [Haloferax sp. CBA1148]MRX23234.1 hypothetical protein [Haloferax litoreum]